MKIVIVDYGSGNLRSVQKGFERAGYAAVVTSDPKAVSDASHLVVPGVGAFPECMKNLEALHLLKPITESIRAGKPYLGICLGLQILFTEGMEFGPHPGLDLVPGEVVRFPENELKVPHMGWNQIRIEKKSRILEGIPDSAYFYFVHSFYGAPKTKEWVATTTDYGVRFPSSIAHENIFACQFHPEKSQKMGLQILANFAKLN
ncbi:MAG: imidazole glycerol phosphate synthase subunit HisH [Candidatus Manganitrophus sp.]|nr:imidazole glycerol phosphate synthase subunit HisH [Candidatus Manganitrophus sp.]